MSDKDRAEENLAIIRSMMERATVYRMISGPTALFGGVLTLLVVFLFPWAEFEAPRDWKWVWFGVAILVLVMNTVLVILKSTREKTTLFSPGLKMGLKAIVPALLIGFVIGIIQNDLSSEELAWIWMLCYGAALCATSSFAPRSMWWLGIFFIVTGLYFFRDIPSGGYSIVRANMMMSQTFGGYHLVYGFYVLLVEKKRS
ncbi:MAG: hypothetical protein ABF328_09920 [Akkermansiaceae bacterium]